ncbi:helix-turn-helix transcriptional regulator [Fictibacillus sp. FJAT-27399]|uniref:helix-turn-helix transcriptional regulator n=1 Tax=Fictibacillus sp. FJAT-27399 TaxID=1729689 RepID=UPI000784A86E|nr:helix-turn-helix transcriptional regulator [Fictibacillus sp. FJAT-27399]
MDKPVSYTIEEVSALLKVSKLTIYDLIKKGEISAFRVGRQMRIDHEDLVAYKAGSRTVKSYSENAVPALHSHQTVISGQDIVLDLLSKHLEPKLRTPPLRLYMGSLNSLMSMYHGECDLVSVHLYDGETAQYNVPYVKRMLVSQPFALINLVCRNAGIYVRKGNPLQIKTWRDLAKPVVTIVNREKGSGARVLLDEQLRLHQISHVNVKGYETEVTNHLSVASAVASGQADAGIGIENVAKMAEVDFIPMIQEQYDLVILKTNENKHLLHHVMNTLSSSDFKSQLSQLKGYDLHLTGQIIYET